MRTRLRLLAVGLVAMLTVVIAMPAGAHPPGQDHTGPGSEGPDLHSDNMKLLANVPPSEAVTQSDLAFRGNRAFAGNYGGFRIIKVKNPRNPRVITDFSCPGSQGDISVFKHLVFTSVDGPRSNDTCDSEPATASTPGAFEGVRIFSVRKVRKPRLLAAVPTDCGSHTNTLVPDRENGRVFIYVSSYPLGGTSEGPNCAQPHGFVSIIEVPLNRPQQATVTKYHLDEDTELATFPLGEAGTFSFRACHDITVFQELGLAAAACLSESQLWDISDPANPEFMWRFDDPAVNNANIDLWHSAAFSYDGEVVAFGDESGGGGAARCVDPNDQQGRIWFVDRESGEFLGNYKVPRSEEGVCTMHNFNFVPFKDGRRVLVSSAYTGGTSVVDVNDPTAPTEIAFYRPEGANTWSSYWYNGYVYANDILRGLDIFRVGLPRLGQEQRFGALNPQTQIRLVPRNASDG